MEVFHIMYHWLLVPSISIPLNQSQNRTAFAFDVRAMQQGISTAAWPMG
jgi:hypothetical protein